MKEKRLILDEIYFKDFETKSTSTNIWLKFHQLNERIKSEIEDRKFFQKREIIERELKYENPDYEITRKLIFKDKSENDLIGFYSYSAYNKESILYEDNKELGLIEINIDQYYTHQGLGTKVMKDIIIELKEKGCTKFKMSTSHSSGKKFCEKFQGRVINIESKSILELSKVNWNLVKEWIIDGMKVNPNVKLEGFYGVSEKNIEEYCLLLSELMNERPTLIENDYEKFFEIVTPKRFREFGNFLEEKFYSLFTYRTIEPDGNISGMTELIFSKINNPERLEQGLTGVKSDYRGKGLGKWLKAAMLYFVKENMPKAKYWITGNAEHNDPMLAINRRLGYRPYFQIITYQFSIDELLKLL